MEYIAVSIVYLVIGVVSANIAEILNMENKTGIPTYLMLIIWPLVVAILLGYTFIKLIRVIVPWPARKIKECIRVRKDLRAALKVISSLKEDISNKDKNMTDMVGKLALQDKLLDLAKKKKLTEYQIDKITEEHEKTGKNNMIHSPYYLGNDVYIQESFNSTTHWIE